MSSPDRASNRSTTGNGAPVLAWVLAGLLATVGLGFPPRVAPAREGAIDIGLKTLATGLGSVTSIASAGDARLFLTTQAGRVRIWDGAGVLPVPFLDIGSTISCCGERGLLSIAFSPLYSSNGFFFVYYTNGAGDLVIARYRVSADPNLADPASAAVLLTIPHPTNSNHNGGELQFGPDGFLYVGTGDGGSANDPPCNAQRLDTLLGKILRIDVNADAAAPPFYAIPSSNPFASSSDGARDEIWAYGLRNPWRFTFDRLTGDLWIGDVGQGTREEIDFQPRASIGGENYGWKIMEGTLCGGGGSSGCPSGVPACNAPSLRLPLFEYSHMGSNCSGSVTGGYVYRGASNPSLYGLYLYGDYCLGTMYASGQLLSLSVPQITTFGQDLAGELYVATGDGVFSRVINPNPVTPTATPARQISTRAPLPRRTAGPVPRLP